MTDKYKADSPFFNLFGHGGNIYLASRETGILESNIIDFSASINPLGVPESVISVLNKNLKQLCNYPNPEVSKLRLKIAEDQNINYGNIICGNGSTELIYLVARALKPKKVLIPAPTFSEYERAVNIAGMPESKTKICFFKLSKERNFDINPDKLISEMKEPVHHPRDKYDMVFLCNPNNPTGRLIKKDYMLKIAEAAMKLKCYLVVDEAFIDFMPDESIIRHSERNSFVIVLRSLTKFYGLSGLRIGYAVFPLHLMDKIKKHQEPWTVNTLAQIGGIAAIDDAKYREKTFAVIQREKNRLEEGFKRLGIKYFPSPVNYYLIKWKDRVKIAPALRRKGILVRDCSNFTGLDESYIRVAVKSKESNIRLLEELEILCRG